MKTADYPITRAVKERLYPLTKVESTLEFLVELLPRALIKVECAPRAQIDIVNNNVGEYRSTGVSPKIELIFSDCQIREGHYYLEASLVRNNGSRMAYIEGVCNGSSEISFRIPVPTNLRGTVREVLCLPARIDKLYLLPTGAPGYFSTSPLLIHKISVLESLLRRAYRVIVDIWHARGDLRDGDECLTWKRAAFGLQDTYLCSARMRLGRYRRIEYSAYIANNEGTNPSLHIKIRNAIDIFQKRPLISLVMIVDGKNLDFLNQALASVRSQIYPHWEMFLLCNFDDNTTTESLVRSFCDNDSRYKLVTNNSNLTIAAQLNKCLGNASGEYFLEVKCRDVLHIQSLYRLVECVNEYPEVDLIYTDHDEIDFSGNRRNPWFKPDWNPEMFYSVDFINPLCLFKISKISSLGGFRDRFKGAEIYDLALRYINNTSERSIKHIPKVMYHRRSEFGAQGQGVRGLLSDSAHQAAKRAIAELLNNKGIHVDDGCAYGLFRVRYPLPNPPPLVSIIIPTKDRVDILKACVESIIEKTTYPSFEIIIINNCSVEPDTIKWLAEVVSDYRVRVLDYNNSFNYSAINNFAARHARGDVLALVNNDVEVITPDWLSEMVSLSLIPGAGAIGAKLLYSNGLVQHAGVVLGIGGVAGHVHRYIDGDDPGYCYRAEIIQNFSAVTGACLVVKKKIYEEVGGMNDKDLKVALNDIDFCLKLISVGYRNIFTPYARLYHHESVSRGRDDTPDKRLIFEKESAYMKYFWSNKLITDPAYNENLTLENENFSIR